MDLLLPQLPYLQDACLYYSITAPIIISYSDNNSIMEALLSLAFDNISSKDGLKIRKGIRQIEGLLAQICLPNPSSRSPHKRRPSTQIQPDATIPKSLHEVAGDPAFREFFRLQESFEWNGNYLTHACHDTDPSRPWLIINASFIATHCMSRDPSGHASRYAINVQT